MTVYIHYQRLHILHRCLQDSFKTRWIAMPRKGLMSVLFTTLDIDPALWHVHVCACVRACVCVCFLIVVPLFQRHLQVHWLSWCAWCAKFALLMKKELGRFFSKKAGSAFPLTITLGVHLFSLRIHSNQTVHHLEDFSWVMWQVWKAHFVFVQRWNTSSGRCYSGASVL